MWIGAEDEGAECDGKFVAGLYASVKVEGRIGRKSLPHDCEDRSGC
jgi:hypothetical protein